MANQLLDKILGSLSADALKYFFPGFSRKKEDDGAVRSASIGFSPSSEDGGVRFSVRPAKEPEISFKASRGFEEDDDMFSDILMEENEDSCVRFSVKEEREEKARKTIDDEFLRSIKPIEEDRKECRREPKAKAFIPSRSHSILGDGKKAIRKVLPEPKPIEPELDPKTKAFLEELEALKIKYGITIEEIEAALSYRVKLSHIRITRHKAIILDDFDHQEVKMDTLTKAVFLLYLKHPEGIRYKDLCDHRRELESIYMSISGRSDLEGIRKSIGDLTDSIMSNSINEKVSKAKKAFRDVVDDRVARFYYIEGKQGAAKRIALDPSLVIWE